jgi:hypothetical protein
MVAITSLWLPILVAAVAVFVVSSIVHMVLPYHRTDYGTVPAEDQVMAALRGFNIPPGDYLMPCPRSRQQMRSPEYINKRKQGPIAIMTVMNGGETSMGRNLAAWFVYLLAVGIFVSYVASLVLPAGISFATVFRLTGSVAFACYAIALWQHSIWYARAWTTTLKSTVDGLLYGVITGGIFGWLWPQ